MMPQTTPPPAGLCVQDLTVRYGTAAVLQGVSFSVPVPIQKYDFWGLVIFVGIPLPGTGAWTGSLVAGLLHMPRKKSFLAIIVGVLLASAIMSIVSYGVLGAFLH